MKSSCRLFTSSFILASLLAVPAPAEEVYVCVWRNPERTMRKIFPEARDYKSLTAKISPGQRARIEEQVGPLLPGQREAFQYYAMTGPKGTVLGHLFAASQKGEYGAIEFVFGINLSGTVTGIYIQRSRERDDGFKKREFLDQFVGMNARDAGKLGETVKAPPTTGTRAVVEGIRKELATFLEVAPRPSVARSATGY